MNPVEYFMKKKVDTEHAKEELLKQKNEYMTKVDELKIKENKAISKKDLESLKKITFERKEAEADATACQSMIDSLFDYNDSEVFEEWVKFVSDTNKELAPELRKLSDMVEATYNQLTKVLPKINKAYTTKNALINMLHGFESVATIDKGYILDSHAELEITDLYDLLMSFRDRLEADYGIKVEDIDRFCIHQINYKEN